MHLDPARSTSLRVLVVHSRYSAQSPSGENQTVAAQFAARKSVGLDCRLYETATDQEIAELGQGRYRVRAAATLLTATNPSLRSAIDQFKPDLIHMHNLFPNIGSNFMRWYPDLPKVMTLHNFRYACARGTLYRTGDRCKACVTRSTLQAVRFRCYRDSTIASFIGFLSGNFSIKHNPVVRYGIAVVYQSERDRVTARSLGLRPLREFVIPNFIRTNSDPISEGVGNRSGCVVSGRRSPEKGLEELLTAWPDRQTLTLIGQDDSLINHGNIQTLPLMPNLQFTRALRRFACLVVPSRWSESGYPRIALEAIAAGTPILAREGNAAADLVRQYGVGEIYASDSPTEIDHAVRRIQVNLESLSTLCQRVAVDHFGITRWQEQMLSAYEDVLEARHT